MIPIRYNVILSSISATYWFRFGIIFIDFSENDDTLKENIDHFPISKDIKHWN